MKSLKELQTVPMLKYSLLDDKRMGVLYKCLSETLHLEGAVYECGVFFGGTALLLATALEGRKTLRLFDSFEGLPEAPPEDNHHKKGDFSQTSFAHVAQLMGEQTNFSIHKGWLPDSLEGLEETVSFVHLDVDLYKSYHDCLDNIYPRLTEGGYHCL